MTSENDHEHGLDPDRVDEHNPLDERCQVVEATTADGQPITFAVHTVTPLTSQEQAMLADIAQAAAKRMERENPHGGVITELMLVSVRSRALLRVAGHGDVAHRLGAAVRAAADAIRQIPRVEQPATSFVEFGVRWTDGERTTFEARDTEQDALEHIDALADFDDSGVLVHRTVTHTAWQTAPNQLPGA